MIEVSPWVPSSPLWFAGTFWREGNRRLANFVKDANQAVRYPSREAAEWTFDILREMRPRPILADNCYQITEHQWLTTVSEKGTT
jgi:hypothetical protein